MNPTTRTKPSTMPMWGKKSPAGMYTEQSKVTTIKLDYDTKFDTMKYIFEARGWVLKKLNFKPESLLVWKSRKGFHVVVEVEHQLTEEQIIMIQCLMQSDVSREILNALRLIKDGNSRNFLFDMKVKFKNEKIKASKIRESRPRLAKTLINIIGEREVEV